MNGIKTTVTMFSAILAAVASFAVISSALCVANADTSAPASKLLSQKQPVKASSVERDGLEAVNAVDGDESTRWSSEFNDAQWIYVDLGAVKNVTEVKIDWETATAKAYDIEVSDDATKWTCIQSVKDNSATGWLDYPKLTAKGRYVRLNLKARATEYGYSIFEFQVFGY
ncbi:MAG: discoidin domain-containing protein [Capsulimonadaceae bacterium]|nr:discoidin domain-containing protein [Capsulimonadaceae bacterium]